MRTILSVNQFRECEQKSPIPVEELISRAGAAVTEEITARFPKSSALVLCGPGNNGKDGVAVARLLRDLGWQVRVVGYKSNMLDVPPVQFDNFETSESIIVDAVFGLGLSRPIEDDLRKVIYKINESGKPVVSIDLPTGINGDTGEIMGSAVRSDLTVTFSCLKFGHVISPGRYYSGEVSIKDIGLQVCSATAYYNTPCLWSGLIPRPSHESHKYNRGYAVVCSPGIRAVGAVKLAALAALRTCPGAVAVACNDNEIALYASALTSVMYKQHDKIMRDRRVTAVLIGPGCEEEEVELRTKVLEVLRDQDRSYVLDAGALSVFQGCSDMLFNGINGRKAVLTPHEGEFRRIFPDLSGGTVERAKKAAKMSGAIVVLKGHDTVIASPDGRVAVNNNAPSALATIGSGDVLAGIITGLVASGMDAFYAACCGVWVHGECGKKYRLGLIADDIVCGIPEVLSSL
ncbi:NAD(P)H-hydrate dehydratase [Candidatus Anaplasma sp. TIGMIC]|uniref:NAD(P)H-hydrate dehydratase n=1 Tax=Candidatus Anaplasma sp. TIGMIC TaxID=3020713 RepID=UPI0023301077|nr:NAD(P)H-hydrate dehydratase [Candidatus Anaplasma sp. TIGMIC]MDB1135730.1 NAD(P)H-hydrate dehydratase [Candidatus Anaplasma sp. TIGMIC]